MAAQDNSNDRKKRVKVYRLDSDGKWDDLGTGYATIHHIEGSEELGLFVYDEEDIETILLHHIRPEVIYRWQEDKIISWSIQEYSTEVALSFERYSCCSNIWKRIRSAQRTQQFNSLSSVGSPMNNTSQSSNIGTKNSLHCEEISEIEIDPLVLAHSHQLLTAEAPTQQEGLNVGADQRTSTINAISETETSVEGDKLEKEINCEIPSKHFGKSLGDAANSFHVGQSTFKRISRNHGIKRWQCRKRRMGIQSSSKLRKVNNKGSSKVSDSYSGTPPLQNKAVVAQTSQDMNKIDVKATYNGVAIRFELLNSSGIVELEDNVIERLKLEKGTFSIKYKDEEGDWVLIACDKDVQKCIEISRSLGQAITRILVDQPISYAR